MNDMATHVMTSSKYAMEFAHDGAFVLVYIRFWREDQLHRTFIKRTGRLLGLTQAEISLVSFVMGAISTTPNMISCTGSTFRTIQMLDKCPYTKYGLKSPPRFEELDLKTLMHRKSFSIFGRIDFFSVLQYLVLSLGGSLDLEWVLLSPELAKVS